MRFKTKFAIISMLFLMVVLNFPDVVNVLSSSGQHGPVVDRLRFKVIKSPDPQLIAMQTCDIDVLTDLMRTSDIETFYADGFTVTSTQGFEMCYFGFNIRANQSYRGRPEVGPVLSDVDFRHALAHLAPNATTMADLFKYIATDHKAMIPLALTNWHNPNVDPHPFNPGDPLASTVYPDDHSACGILRYGGYIYDMGLNNWVTPYDLDGDAIPGTTDGTITDPDDVVPFLKVFTPTYEVLPALAELGARWVADIHAIGLTSICHEPAELFPYLMKVLAEADFDMYLMFWRPDRFPHHLFDMLHSSQDSLVYPGRHNAPGILSPDLDAKLETLMFSLDHDEKVSATKKVQEMIANGSDYWGIPYIPLYTRKYFDAFKPGLEGVINSHGYGSNNEWTFLNMRWEPGHPNERIEGSDSTIIWCLSEEPESFNPLYAYTPYAWEILDRVYDPLIATNPYSHKNLAWLATDWEVVETPGGPGAMNVTFWLNSTVEWQDGNLFTAEDARFNWLFLRDNQIPRYASMSESIQDVQVIISGVGGVVRVISSNTSQFLLYDLAETSALLPPPVWSPLDGRPLDEILSYSPSTNTSIPSGAGPRFGTEWCPTQLYGTGPWIFDYYDPVTMYAEMLANRYYFKTTDEIHDHLMEMFHYVGDLNRDGTVWGQDLLLLHQAWGSHPGDPHWNPDADITGPSCMPDSVINDYDKWMVQTHFGLQAENSGYASPPVACPPPLYANYTLTITHSGGGVTEPPAGVYNYTEYTIVDVIALPNANYSFDCWELDGIETTENPISVMVDNDHSLQAIFIYGPPPVTATIEGYVTDNQTGAPIAGAAVTCSGYADLTDASGFYQLLNIPAQTFTITVTKKGYETASETVDASAGGIFTMDVALTQSPLPPPSTREWRYPLQSFYVWGLFGSSPAIGDVRDDIEGLEVALGSDEYFNYYPEIGSANGIWRLLNSTGGLIWAKATDSDESRSSPALADLNGDGYLEIVGGTTSGSSVEAIDRFGNFIWTFPHPPSPGSFMWPSSPAIADVDPTVSGLEVIIGNRPLGSVWALDGDNTDGINEGVTVDTADYPWATGTEGVDWDVLWIFSTQGSVWSTPAIGDIDEDGNLEVVIGSDDGHVYALDGATGAPKWACPTGSPVRSSAALADLDDDTALEVVIGCLSGKIFCLDGFTGSQQWNYQTGGAVNSSPAVYFSTIFIGSADGRVYSLNATGSVKWVRATGYPVYSSPAIANRGGNIGIYIGSGELYCGSGALFILDATDGSIISEFETASIHTSPSVADIDSDHKLEIVFYDWAGNFWCLEDTTSQAAAQGLDWPMFRRNANRTGSMTILGDFDYDGDVDLDDIALFAEAYGSSVGQPAYDPECDVDRDGVVNLHDLAIVGKNYGKGI